MKKKSILAGILVGVMTLASACGAMKPEEAKAYTQATLDAVYCGELDEYVRIVDTTKEEAQKMYEEGIQLTLEKIGLDEMGASDEIKEQYKEVVVALAKAAKYEVGEAVENEQDGFDVEVTVQPFQGFGDLEDELTNALMKELKNMDDIPSDEEINTLTYSLMADLMKETLEAPEYGEATTVTVHVNPDEDGVYHIPEEDMEMIDSALFLM